MPDLNKEDWHRIFDMYLNDKRADRPKDPVLALAKHILGDMIHYRSGCNHEGEDIRNLASALAMMTERQGY